MTSLPPTEAAPLVVPMTRSGWWLVVFVLAAIVLGLVAWLVRALLLR